MIKNVIFTGGGSGGHVVPGITLIKEIQLKHPEVNIQYIGSRYGIERSLVGNYGIPYKIISTGKLRRYFSWQNFLDIIKVCFGVVQAFFFLLRFKSKETIVFSTGGFVSVPVALAGKLTGKRVYIHEQTSRIGLANKIASKFATKVFVSFQDSLKLFPKEKVVHSGYPVRDTCFVPVNDEVIVGEKDIRNVSRPILFLTGGGNGSSLINKFVRNNFDELIKKYFILHQVGSSEFEEYSSLKDENYLPVKFLGEEMIDCFKLASIVVSRSGAGTVCELLAIGKKSIYVPLKIAQKNEQYHNAMAAYDELGSIIISEDEARDMDFMKLLSEFSPFEGKKNGIPKNPKSIILNEIF